MCSKACKKNYHANIKGKWKIKMPILDIQKKHGRKKKIYQRKQ